MPEYLSPGVYVEEVDTGSKPIEGVGTAMPAFVGFTPGGEFHKAELITNWTQFCDKFGDETGNPYVPGGYLAHAVYGYFGNGGSRCYVARIPSEDDVKAATKASPAQHAIGKLGPISVRALQAGSAGNNVTVKVEQSGDDPVSDAKFKLVISDGEKTETIETIGSGKNTQPLSVQTATQVKSSLIEIVEVSSGTVTESSIQLSGGTAAIVPVNGSKDLSANDFVGDEAKRTGMGGFTAADDVTMLCCPDLMSGFYKREKLQPKLRRVNGKDIGTCPRCKQAIGLDPLDRCPKCGTMGDEVVDAELVEAKKPKIIAWQEAMLSHCAQMHDRVAILDAPPGLDPMGIKKYRMVEANFNSKYGALYYPWIQVMDPVQNAPVYVPPCGHMAGIWARNDSERGVHKAPANEVIRGAIGFSYNISKGEQDVLNPEGINCLREFPGRGRLVWGARTLSADPSWKYLNVRRLFNYLEKSIEKGTQWTVFEPNDYDLWQRVRRNINAFLTMAWREGMLFGTTPDEAFFVKCDSETNPPESIELGRLVCEIGVRPVFPAEFVIFRIGQWAAGGE